MVAPSPESPVEYDVVDGRPVLVDFDNSILVREDIRGMTSVVTRRAYGGLMGVAKRIVSPPKRATRANLERLMGLLLGQPGTTRVLVVGGGTVGQGLEPLYDASRIEVAGFDIYSSRYVQFVADAHQIPLVAGSFDAVIVQAVLEHVLDPAQVVAEIHRVLKPHGLVYAETPFLQHVHEGAYDFTRFTESGHRYLFRRFEVIGSGAVAGAGTQLLWSVDNFFRGLFRSRTAGKVAKLCCFWLQYLDALIPEAFNVDAASGVYFLGRRQETAVSPHAMVAHYQGAQ
jgi:SAM-dependent methyltransferase